jgi:calcineurin-like phosphoesterase family protein
MARIFLISDNHFTDYDGLISILNRPYKNSADMNANMIKMWNEGVQHEDTVFSAL